jgi:hypothetical protein
VKASDLPGQNRTLFQASSIRRIADRMIGLGRTSHLSVFNSVQIPGSGNSFPSSNYLKELIRRNHLRRITQRARVVGTDRWYIASEARNSLIDDRRTAFPSNPRLNGVRPDPLSWISYRFLQIIKWGEVRSPTDPPERLLHRDSLRDHHLGSYQ